MMVSGPCLVMMALPGVSSASSGSSASSATTCADVTFSAKDAISDASISGASFMLYEGYPIDYKGCSYSQCGTQVETITRSSAYSLKSGKYLVVSTTLGYYVAYYTFQVSSADPLGVEMILVKEMEVNQDRVISRWNSGGDRDVYIWDFEGVTKKSNSFMTKLNVMSGATVQLDKDMVTGPGIESTQLKGMTNGVLEVWVRYLGGTGFTLNSIQTDPSIVDIYCYRCQDENLAIHKGFVTTVTQSAVGWTAGSVWWKAGEFRAGNYFSGNERVQWKTCRSNCFDSSRITTRRSLSETPAMMIGAQEEAANAEFKKHGMTGRAFKKSSVTRLPGESRLRGLCSAPNPLCGANAVTHTCQENG
jgi:hypothetical protein